MCQTFSEIMIQEAAFMLSKNPIKRFQKRDAVNRKLFGMWISFVERNQAGVSSTESVKWIKNGLECLKKFRGFLNPKRICTEAILIGTCEYSPCQNSPHVLSCGNIEQCLMATNCIRLLKNHKIPNYAIPEQNWQRCCSTTQYDHYKDKATIQFYVKTKTKTEG